MFTTLTEYIRAFYRAILVVSIITGSVVISLALAVIIIPFSRPQYIAYNARRILQRTAKLLLAVLGVRIHRNLSVKSFDTLFASNHWGYLDSLILMAMSPCLVISSSEVRRMPIIGFLLSMMGFFFVDRGNKRSIPLILKKASRIAAKTGINIAFFPEGGTSNGSSLRSFHSSFFELAKMTDYSVQPIVLNIVAINNQNVTPQNINKVVFYGPALSETTVISHIFQLLRLKVIDITVDVLQDIPWWEIKSIGLDRKQICQRCESLINDSFTSMIAEK